MQSKYKSLNVSLQSGRERRNKIKKKACLLKTKILANEYTVDETLINILIMVLFSLLFPRIYSTSVMPSLD